MPDSPLLQESEAAVRSDPDHANPLLRPALQLAVAETPESPEAHADRPGIDSRQIQGRIFWVFPDRFDTRPDKSSWLEMARALSALGWQTTILAACSNPASSDYNGLVRYVRSVALPFLFRCVLLVNSLRVLLSDSTADDVVIVNQDGLWLLPVLRLAGRKHVHLDIRTIPLVTRRGLKNRLDDLLFWTVPMRLFARYAESHSFITEPLRKAVEKEFALGINDYSIWQSGVNTELFNTSSRTSNVARNTSTFTIFYHGGLLSTRGIDLVIKALVSREYDFGVKFLIVGDGPDRMALEKLTAALDLGQRVEFMGFVPYESVPELIAAADCCICPLPDLPEWRVSSPLKVLEYLSCGQRLILTPLDAHLEVAAGLPGIVWTDGFSPSAIGNAIVEAHRLGRVDETTSERLRSHIVERYEWRIHASTLLKQLASHVERR